MIMAFKQKSEYAGTKRVFEGGFRTNLGAIVIAVGIANLFNPGIAKADVIEAWGGGFVDIQIGDYIEYGAGAPANISVDDGFGRRAAGIASADFGVHRLSTFAENLGAPGITVFAEAMSTWNQTLLISGGAGTGFADIRLRLHASFWDRGAYFGADRFPPYFTSYQIIGPADGGPTDTAGFMTVPSWDSAVLSWNPDGTADSGDVLLEGSFFFTYDVPFVLYSMARSYVFADSGVDALNTVEVTSLTLPSGASVDSNAGEEGLAGLRILYGTSVPEPGTLELTFVGLLLSGLAALRRRMVRSRPG